jgi:membrane protease YdiL (CAAX protease family)
MLVLALATMKMEYISLFPQPHFGWKHVAMIAAFLAISLGTLPVRWNWRTEDEKRRMLWRIPVQPSHLWGWALVSLSAGIVEEVVFRGVLFQLWDRLIGVWPAVAVCSIAFALAHYVQGVRSMAVILLMALANHLIVFASGDLYTMMIIHVVYDFLAGIVFLSLAKRDRLVQADVH